MGKRQLRYTGESERAARENGAKERGADLIEYVMLVALMIFVAMVALRYFSQSASTQYSDISSVIESI